MLFNTYPVLVHDLVKGGGVGTTFDEGVILLVILNLGHKQTLNINIYKINSQSNCFLILV